jgi:hypothetical protein
MADKGLILKGFNEHFSEFICDVQQVFPNDVDLLATKNALIALRKANPKMIIDVWYRHITLQYGNEINDSNMDFFLDKDYSGDINMKNTDQILNKINALKQPIRDMGVENQEKTMKYIQNLSKLTNLYFIK